MNDLISQLPKAELHLHIEGTLEPQMLLDLAQRNRVRLPYDSVESVQQAYQFDCLQDFLDLYYMGTSVLTNEQDFYDLTMAYLDKVATQGVVHTEIFFDPQAHTDRGIEFAVVIRGIHRALQDGHKKHGISNRLIMCFLRHLSEDQAFHALRAACDYKDVISGVGLDSSENGFPPSNFSRVFEAAIKEGFIPVAHAGEEGPPEYVAGALDQLQVRRIDHGNRALEDIALIRRLVSEQIPLTMCPLSNLRLQVIQSMQDCPVKTALDAGLLVTVNSDDPSYFGGYINENYRAVQDGLGLDNQTVVQLARNSFVASFLAEADKQKHLQAVDQYAARY